ncbi:DUF4124 domain-containing protein [Xanthomonas oryzae]|uniref:DUF4124 domain-containing protein n=1 Tax=Xanthomonas oryzae TaxID=347 RepID=UPI0021170FAD|nr:DUF4124 domain-containing protein [Xanthomonas oryzae]WDN29486.1 DUF4124 domain-containing protein [Xanthomonas oryzae]WDN34029.1 DUF4124 domain-containing protein [Xanthomonas oryzae]WEE91938.1 DUF4124 domain-containing protein [Xanthomonas oryzae]WEE91947.1 DUF4124 domain-containing protein [Xanthomonas oryzae]WEE92881.1 DUF4124 domain-containing protein [Xanthomonas oryzae]
MESNKARIMPFIKCSSLVLIMFIFSPNADAQQVHKCRERGQVVYQSAPCAAGPAEKVWAATPVAEPTNAELWRRYRIQKQLDRRYAADRASASAAYVSGSSSGSACESAKRSRATVYEAAGVHRDFALSSQWDNAVQDACK